MKIPSVAIIGGTGIGDRLLANGGIAVGVPTKFGLVRARVASGVLVLARHGCGHRLPPHSVNYRAMAQGLRQLGIRYCIGSAAVGSLRPDWPAGTIVACDDFVDVSSRNLTLFEQSVSHTDFTQPFDPSVHAALCEAGAGESRGTYVNANGPRYETPAEIAFYKQIGGDVVGMTAGSEAIAMREAGVGYACLAVVSNLAAGMEGKDLTHEEVVEQMSRSGEAATKVLLGAAEALSGSRI